MHEHFWSASTKACNEVRGKAVHGHSLKSGGCLNLFFLNILHNMHARFDLVDESCNSFAEMRMRNMVSLVTLIQALAKCGQFLEASHIFIRLHKEGRELHQFVFTTILKLLICCYGVARTWLVCACLYFEAQPRVQCMC